MITERVRKYAEHLAGAGDLPAFVYDLDALAAHAADIRRASLSRSAEPTAATDAERCRARPAHGRRPTRRRREACRDTAYG